MTKHHVYLGLLVSLCAACGSGGTNQTDEGAAKLVVGDNGTNVTSALYQMPTPNELFSLVSDMAGDGQKRLMNPATHADRYVSLRSRAFNFGVYSTDLIYASYFKLNVEVVRYYLTVKKLGEQLGLSSAFSDKDFVRLEANLTRGDSLEAISNGVYYKAYEQLQQEEMGATLSLVLAGGWIESMHLLMSQVRGFSADDPLVLRAAEQKATLEHLIDLMEQNATDADVQLVRERMIDIRGIYDRAELRRSQPDKALSASGRMILGEDVRVVLNEGVYEALREAVEAVREEMTRPEGQVSVKTNA